MVYLRIIPFGLLGGNQDTTTLLGEEGTALMPAGGPGTTGQHTDISPSAERECVCVCVSEHVGCWVAVKVSRLVCRLLDLSCAKPLCSWKRSACLAAG